MADISEVNAAGATKIIGSDIDGGETTPVGATENQEIKSFDVADNGGIDTILDIAPGAVVELKVGATVKAVRKYVQIQAKDKNITWGFSLTTQSFDAFKSQFFILPFGAGTSVYLKNNGAASADVAIAEVS